MEAQSSTAASLIKTVACIWKLTSRAVKLPPGRRDIIKYETVRVGWSRQMFHAKTRFGKIHQTGRKSVTWYYHVLFQLLWGISQIH